MGVISLSSSQLISKFVTVEKVITMGVSGRKANIKGNEVLTEELLDNAKYLAINVYDKLIDVYGLNKFTITNWYRCSEYNNLVGGSKNSQHLFAQAIDIQGTNGLTNKEIYQYIRDNLEFDQLIDENNLSWVHVSYNKNKNRKEELKVNGNTTKRIDTGDVDSNNPLVQKEIPPQPKIEGYFDYIHGDSNITSINQIIIYRGWLDPIKSNQLCRDTTIVSLKINGVEINRDAIFSKYSQEEADLYKNKEQNFIKIGTKLKIPLACIDRGAIGFEANSFVFKNDSYNSFVAPAFKKILSDPSYKKDFNNKLGGSIEKSFPQISVWVWCKTLGDQSDLNIPFSTHGEIFNLTPFVMSANTNVSISGGNFSIALPPITCECETVGFNVRESILKKYVDDQKNALNFVSQNKVHKVGKNVSNGSAELKRNNFLFNSMISSNDIVFIRFEKLQSEREREDENDFFSDTNKIYRDKLPNQTYDMIGLVDKNTITYDTAGNQISINVSGRDLMKLLIEDGSYYINIPGMQQTIGNFANENFQHFGRPDRNPTEFGDTQDVITPFANPTINPTIENCISYIISALATIEICPDSLFDSYPEDRKSTYDKLDTTYTNSNTNDVNRLVKERVTKYKAAGIWQIIKLLVDDEAVKDRKVWDTGLAVHSGSLLAAIQKYCDGTFVEFFSDTYGDQFYFMVRRPPFNKTTYLDLVKLINDTKIDGDSPLEISDNDVIGDSLEFSDEAYCWYRLTTNSFYEGVPTPQNLTTLGTFPVVYFREYNEIWGNRSFDKVTNYIPYDPYISATQNRIKPPYEQITEDLKYMVESHAYLPFTRSGTITLNGDRRIKRGVCIRYKPTNEIFYVDSVQQTYSIVVGAIQRRTILHVSRGMVEFNRVGNYILPLYFDLINFGDTENKDSKKEEFTVEGPFVLDVYFDTDEYVIIDPNRTVFNFDSKDVQDPVVRKQLYDNTVASFSKIANDLQGDPDMKVEINGYTDNRPTNKFIGGNLELSQKRVDSLQQLILNSLKFYNNGKIVASGKNDEINPNTQKAIDQVKSRITAIGRGEDNPIDTNETAEGRAHNRRVEVKYTVRRKIEPMQVDNPGLNWKVRQDIFNFFLRRKQFCDNLYPFDFNTLGTFTYINNSNFVQPANPLVLQSSQNTVNSNNIAEVLKQNSFLK